MCIFLWSQLYLCTSLLLSKRKKYREAVSTRNCWRTFVSVPNAFRTRRLSNNDFVNSDAVGSAKFSDFSRWSCSIDNKSFSFPDFSRGSTVMWVWNRQRCGSIVLTLPYPLQFFLGSRINTSDLYITCSRDFPVSGGCSWHTICAVKDISLSVRKWCRGRWYSVYAHSVRSNVCEADTE